LNKLTPENIEEAQRAMSEELIRALDTAIDD